MKYQEGTFTKGFKDWRNIKRKVSQDLGDFQILLIKFYLASCFKASAEKEWLLYESPFSSNPGDKPNVAQT